MSQPASSENAACSTACCSSLRPSLRRFLLIAALLPGTLYFTGLAAIYLLRPLRWPGFGGYEPVNLALAILGLYGLFGLWALVLKPQLRQALSKPLLYSFVLGWLAGGYVVLRAMAYWANKADLNIFAGNPPTAIMAGGIVALSFVLLLTLAKFIAKAVFNCCPAAKC